MNPACLEKVQTGMVKREDEIEHEVQRGWHSSRSIPFKELLWNTRILWMRTLLQTEHMIQT
jgi:hypothetical protein